MAGRTVRNIARRQYAVLHMARNPGVSLGHLDPLTRGPTVDSSAIGSRIAIPLGGLFIKPGLSGLHRFLLPASLPLGLGAIEA
ncbi:uncharacterized protein PG998_001825 [Apiospora kogelbergensis]|uniref:uncharacterized protein n=1 Tax=Apiospora kogelbergensis TaxID=1337665 RepID=UPI00312D3B70